MLLESNRYFGAAINKAKSVFSISALDNLPRADRQRGLWNFLTWSFVLANFLAATEVYAGSAHTATSAVDEGHNHGDGDGSSLSGVHASVVPPIQGAASGHEPTAADPKVLVSLLGTKDLPGTIGIPAISTSDAEHTSGNALSASISSGIESQAPDHHDLSSISEVTPGLQSAVDAIPGIVGHVADIVSPLASDIAGIVTQAVDTLAQATDNGLTVEFLHATNDAISSVIGLSAPVLDTASASLTTVASNVANILTISDSPFATDKLVAQSGGSLNLLHDLGLSSGGAMSFAVTTPEVAASADSAPSAGYSQYNISVQDAAAPDAISIPTDTGSITTIVTSALGIGHAVSSDANPNDHSSDQQSFPLSQVDDLTAHHNNLLG